MPTAPFRGRAWSFRRAAAVALVVLLPAALQAQARPRATGVTPPPAPGSITGTVIDSLTGGRGLSGADVYLAESLRSAVTDDIGRFTIDSLPPGTYTIAFSSPTLDSLGLGVRPAAVTVSAGWTQQITLVTPSPRTVARALCPTGMSDSTGAVIGVVIDAARNAPVAGAHVSAVWTTFVQTPSGVLRVPRTAVGVADAHGVYRACGVPTHGPVTVRATAPPELGATDPKSGSGVLELGGGLGMQNLSIALLPTAVAGAPTARRAGTPLVVTVTRPDGAALAGAQLQVTGDSTTAVSDASGRARFANAPLGTRAVQVRALGFSPQLVAVDLRADRAAAAAVRLARAAPTLDTVKVLARGGGDATGFEQRQRTGLGYYLNEQQIDDRRAIRFSELLRTVPGVTLSSNGGGTVVAMRGSAGAQSCSPSVYVDGITVGSMGSGASASLDDFLPPGEVGAIEVYPGSAGVPPQYAGRGTCGTILVWTRTGGRAPRR